MAPVVTTAPTIYMLQSVTRDTRGALDTDATATVMHVSTRGTMTPVSPVDRTSPTTLTEPTAHTTATAPVAACSMTVLITSVARNALPPDVPDAGSSTLVGQPDNMSPVLPLASPRKRRGGG